MQLQLHTLALVAVALAPAATAQSTNPFLPEPASYLRGFCADPQTASLVELGRGDFDNDQRIDLVVRDDEGHVGLLFAHGERQSGQFLPLELEATDIAVLDRDSEADGIYVAHASGVDLWEIGEEFGGEVVTTIVSGAVTALHYAHQPGHVWGCMWIGIDGGTNLDSVQGILIDPSTGGVLLALSPIALQAELGESWPVDLGANGLYELAITTSAGCAIFDGTGLLTYSLRQLTGSTLESDRLARLDDGDGSQRIVWSESTGTGGRLHLLSGSTPSVITYTPAAAGAIGGVHANGDGLADLVLPGTGSDRFRVLLAQSSGARYTPGTGEQTALLPAGRYISELAENVLALDIERDADEDLVLVDGSYVVQLRNQRLDVSDHWLDLVDLNSSVVDTGATVVATLNFSLPTGTYDRVRGRVHAQNTDQGLLRRSGTVTTLPDKLTSSPISYSLTLTPYSGMDREIWYLELELVKDATSTSAEIVYPTLCYALTASESTFLELLLDPEEDAGLWSVPFAPYAGHDDPTHGSATVPVIPRLPPPPPPKLQ